MVKDVVEEAKKKAMYDGEAGKRRATVEVAVAQAEKLRGLLGGVRVLPEKAFVGLFSEGGKMPVVLSDDLVGGK